MKQIEKDTIRENEMIARLMLLNAGWRVHTSDTDEIYDVLATDPVNGVHYRISVARVYQDKKRGGLFISIKKPLENTYTDLILGVLRKDAEQPRGFLLKNKTQKFYHSRTTKPSERWAELNIVLDLSLLISR